MPSKSNMQISEAGIAEIKSFEEFRALAYLCPAKRWTYGYGETMGVKPGDRITEPEADRLLRRRLQGFAACVNRDVKVALTQAQFDALVSLEYNIGHGNFEHSTLLKLLNAGNYRAAAEQFPRWVMAGDKKLAGLVKRRLAEQKKFQKDIAA